MAEPFTLACTAKFPNTKEWGVVGCIPNKTQAGWEMSGLQQFAVITSLGLDFQVNPTLKVEVSWVYHPTF